MPFESELTIEGMRRGMSAKYVIWLDPGGRAWPMFIAELLDLLRRATIERGTVRGWWIPCKRGQNFGLRYLGPDKPDETHGA